MNKGVVAGLIGLGVLLCIVVIVYLVMANKTEAVTGQVQSVHWSRTIVVEGLRPVEREAWYDEVPADAELGACTLKYHHTEQELVEGAREVCGTPYTVDTGSGAGEVVQDCVYEVDADWCKYTVQEWQQIDALVLEGNDLSPAWPQLTLADGEREGEQTEEYQVTFSSDGQSYRWDTSSQTEFVQYEPGSKWQLEVNTFDQLMGVSPAN